MDSKNTEYILKLPEVQQEKIRRILDLKEKYNVLLLAHTYQREPIQLIADVLGDSLKLARAAQKEREADYILFCGVRFMAETASIINQNKKIVFPEPQSTCSMASYANADILRVYKRSNPGIPIMVYINSNAETKTMADVICTSSNSVHIAKKIQEEFNSRRIAFSPDKNLGRYIASETGIDVDIVPEEGNCYVHNDYTIDDVKKASEKWPDGKLLVHPESPLEVLNEADFVGSTSQIIRWAEENLDVEPLIIGTEIGVTEYLRREYPLREIVPLSEKAVCKAMKQITLDSIIEALIEIDSQKYAVKVDEDTAKRSKDAINKMMELSKSIK